ncbi:Fibrinogen C domain-containing protein 1 [Amphibalanus amphitrite]|uniref:Fibrinogen C domain-containing protein 1 n=1 Tax=Amphibalanus amphitrite TaxID=1232801 RepID=A0A6A4W218_AMPAM|nr:Fibrinogen C domain-containing protein 1 [Amphibalanus amphitrite]
MAVPVRWLLAAGLAAAVAARPEFPDLTLVLQPDEELDWNQITRWMEQSRFSVDAGSQHHALPPRPVDPIITSRAASPRHTQQDQPAVPSAIPTEPPPARTPPGPQWRPVVPGPALVPGAPPPSAPASWRPQWPELVPPAALVPQPPPALIQREQAALRPTFPELQRGESLLPADAPGAHQPEPATEPPPAASAEPSAAPIVLLPTDERERYQPPEIEDYDQQPPPAQLRAAGSPPVTAAHSPSARDRSERRPYQQAPRPTQSPEQPYQYTDQLPATHSAQPLPKYSAQNAAQQAAGNQPQQAQQQAQYPTPKPSEYPVPEPTKQSQYSVPQPVEYSAPQPTKQFQYPVLKPTQHPVQQPPQQPVPKPSENPLEPPAEYPIHEQLEYPAPRQPEQEYPVQRQREALSQPGPQETQFLSDETGPQSSEYGDGAVLTAAGAPSPLAPRLLAQEKTPAASVADGVVGGSMPPGALAVLLQRLEERMVAGETQMQRHTTLLRTAQHSQRKAEVVAAESQAAIRSEFQQLNTRLDGMQSDVGRVTSLLETVLAEVQAGRRAARERAARQPTGTDPSTAQLEQSVAQLDKKLGQLVVNTELLKGGQRRLDAHVRTVENRTSELNEQAEQFATKVGLATSLTEMRAYLDRQQRRPTVTASAGDESLPADCSDVLLSGEQGATSGIYQVRPRHATQPIFVYCDQKTDGGGWAVSTGMGQEASGRTNGDEDFFRDWISYKYGFGNLAGEFWLGNENIHLLTSHRLNELRVELSDFPRQRSGHQDYPGSNATARYGAFAIGAETEGYALKVLDNYSGDAGDSLKYHAGMKFSTKDVDNDLWKEDSCALNHKGGWWYKGCDSSNLNGLYLSGPVPSEYEYQVAYWYDWRGPLYSLYRTQMMVRPADHAERAAAAAAKGRRRAGRAAEDGKTAAQRRLGTQTVRGRGRRRRQRRRRGRRAGP